MSVSEACEGNLFHRTPLPAIREGGVVNHCSGTHVDAVVGVAETRSYQVCAQRRLFTRRQPSIVAIGRFVIHNVHRCHQGTFTMGAFLVWMHGKW